METIDATATPMTEPAMPIFDDSRNDVIAASAPANSWEKDTPLKKFFTARRPDSLVPAPGLAGVVPCRGVGERRAMVVVDEDPPVVLVDARVDEACPVRVAH